MPSERFYVMDAPVAGPGSCGICGYSEINVRRYLDTRLSFEFYGVLYLCELCVGEMSRHFGFELPDNVARVAAENAMLQTELIELRSKLRATNDYVVSVLGVSINTGTISPEPVSNLVFADEGAEGPTENSLEDVPDSAVITSEQGPDDVRDTESNFGFFTV